MPGAVKVRPFLLDSPPPFVVWFELLTRIAQRFQVTEEKAFFLLVGGNMNLV
jgi:hypothetical protein